MLKLRKGQGEKRDRERRDVAQVTGDSDLISQISLEGLGTPLPDIWDPFHPKSLKCLKTKRGFPKSRGINAAKMVGFYGGNSFFQEKMRRILHKSC